MAVTRQRAMHDSSLASLSKWRETEKQLITPINAMHPAIAVVVLWNHFPRPLGKAMSSVWPWIERVFRPVSM